MVGTDLGTFCLCATGSLRVFNEGCSHTQRRSSASAKGVMSMTTFTIRSHHTRRGERRRLIRHFLEMVAAMAVGMAVLGGVVRLTLAMLGVSDFLADRVGIAALVMTVNMTIGMAVWMRHRGHGWGAIAEMSAAMFAPLAILIGPFSAGALSGDALLGWMHVLMLPAMAIAMRHRRAEYAQNHHVPAISEAASPPVAMS
jgi:hypothetical protein